MIHQFNRQRKKKDWLPNGKQRKESPTLLPFVIDNIKKPVVQTGGWVRKSTMRVWATTLVDSPYAKSKPTPINTKAKDEQVKHFISRTCFIRILPPRNPEWCARRNNAKQRFNNGLLIQMYGSNAVTIYHTQNVCFITHIRWLVQQKAYPANSNLPTRKPSVTNRLVWNRQH